MSLAQFTLAGVGGLIAAQLAGNAGFPFLLALPLAVLGTIPVGLIVGLPSARTRGVSLAVATLGLAVAIQALVFSNDSLAGGIRRDHPQRERELHDPRPRLQQFLPSGSVRVSGAGIHLRALSARGQPAPQRVRTANDRRTRK